MRSSLSTLAISLTLLASLASAISLAEEANAPPTTTLVTPEAKRGPVQPWETSIPLDNKGKPDEDFMKAHESFLQRGKTHEIGLLLLGDSITALWTSSDARDIYDRTFGQYKVANFGVAGDRTDHVLWRIENGELDNIKPKAVMLMIGTNNMRNPRNEDIARGVATIVEHIRAKLPETKILLLGIFPRGTDPADPKVAAMRKKVADTNAILAKLDDGLHVKYLDIGEKFLDDKGMLTQKISTDAQHLTPAGYQIWADAVTPTLDEIMK